MITAAAVLGAACLVTLFASGSDGQRRFALFVGAAAFTALRWDNRLYGWPTVIILLALLLAVRPRRESTKRGLDRYQRLALALAVTALVSMIWSPIPVEASATAGRWIALVLAIAVVREALDRREDVLAICYGVMVPMIAVAVTVIWFHYDPIAEEAYYRSELSTVFLRDTGQAMYQGSILTVNNAVELERAAGFLFVNVNRASMVLGVSATLMLAVALKYRARALKYGAILLAVAIPVTGSKTGLALLLLAIGAILAARLAAHLGRGMEFIVTTCALVAAGLVVRTVINSRGDLILESQSTLSTRQELWPEAWRAATENPILGLGFGGWLDRWANSGVNVEVVGAMRPAHNWFIQAWLDGGFVYMALNVVLALLMLAAAARSYRLVANGEPTWRLLAALPGLWIVIHGLGDNSALYGDTAAIVPLALALTLSSRPTQDALREGADSSRRQIRTGR